MPIHAAFANGHKPYLNAVEAAFGAEIDYAVLQKIYGNEANPEKGYSPAVCLGYKVENVTGDPNPKHISTSYVERQNLTMRMSMRRFTHLTNAFSKKVENHAAAIALYFMYYNFGRVHQTLRVTPRWKLAFQITCGASRKSSNYSAEAHMAAPRLPAAWQNAGYATGGIRCKISLPASDTRIDMRCNRTLHAFRDACRFIRRHLPSTPLALDGAAFTISAEIRAQSGGVRHRVICQWRAGESVDAALDEATRTWAQLPKERRE